MKKFPLETALNVISEGKICETPIKRFRKAAAFE